MAEPSFGDQVAVLDATLRAIEARFARGQVADEGLADFKSALDDLRLRLWGVLSGTGGPDSRGIQERFRIRRTTEMCSGLGADLRAGGLAGYRQELGALREAVQDLTRNIEHARREAF